MQTDAGKGSMKAGEKWKKLSFFFLDARVAAYTFAAASNVSRLRVVIIRVLPRH